VLCVLNWIKEKMEVFLLQLLGQTFLKLHNNLGGSGSLLLLLLLCVIGKGI
jgi:hypothetical protein